MTGEIERLKREETQAAQEKKKAAEALMVEVHRSNDEQASAAHHTWHTAHMQLHSHPAYYTYASAFT